MGASSISASVALEKCLCFSRGFLQSKFMSKGVKGKKERRQEEAQRENENSCFTSWHLITGCCLYFTVGLKFMLATQCSLEQPSFPRKEGRKKTCAGHFLCTRFGPKQSVVIQTDHIPRRQTLHPTSLRRRVRLQEVKDLE